MRVGSSFEEPNTKTFRPFQKVNMRSFENVKEKKEGSKHTHIHTRKCCCVFYGKALIALRLGTYKLCVSARIQGSYSTISPSVQL